MRFPCQDTLNDVKRPEKLLRKNIWIYVRMYMGVYECITAVAVKSTAFESVQYAAL